MHVPKSRAQSKSRTHSRKESRNPSRTTTAPRKRPLSPTADSRFPTAAPPRSRDQLRAWIKAHLHLTIPDHPENGPFDFLCHTFFEGQEPADRQSPIANGQSAAGALAATADSRLPTADLPLPTADCPLPTPAPPDSVLWSCRGGGKTHLAAVATALDLLFKPGIQVQLLAGSLEQAQRMHAHLKAIFQRTQLLKAVKGRITSRGLRLKNGSSASLMAHSETSVRGVHPQKIRCDEVELITREVFDAAQLATESRLCGDILVRGSVECFSTMHQPWGVMQRLVEECNLGRRRLFKWNIADVLARCGPDRHCNAEPSGPPESPGASSGLATPPNPEPRSIPLSLCPSVPLSLSPPPCPLYPDCRGRAKDPSRTPGHFRIADAITMKDRVGLPQWNAEMSCLRPTRANTVLPEFDPETHVVATLPWETAPASDPHSHATPSCLRASVPSCLPLCGMDFGFRAPTVILWAALDPAGTLWVVDERVAAEQIISRHIEALAASPWPRPLWIGIDPAGTQRNDHTGETTAQLLARADFTTRHKRLSVHLGLQHVRARLHPASGPPRLYIHRRCRTLIESLEKYHYDPDRLDRSDPIKDGHDHAVDALRYLILNLDAPETTRRGTHGGF